ncbi:T9SS type A sorting domain-containing protein [Melioribacter sp. Ez-97]|uniref:T9SS type A sorting domain-containing protein n=1 Tax=Melioribacter sp. Ez-97 TaxID=3423434 RepID=UPI003ED9F39E
MKKLFSYFLTLLLLSFSSSFAQGLMDYVEEIRGDTLVIKDYYDMSGEANSLSNAIAADTDAPAGRVYELKTAGWYPLSATLTTPADRPTVIVGADDDILVQRQAAPPIISGYSDEGGSSPGGITWSHDLTVKNTSIICGAPDGTYGWAFFNSGAADRKIVFQNNMMEHNWWVFVQSNAHSGNRLFFKDNYFVNMSGRACRRNGGVYDNVDNNTDTIYVENNTHVMAQGYIYKFRNYPIKFIYVNHNTFVNCSNVIFETQGVQSNSIITNNIFVNSNVQPFRPNMTEDISEQAIDGQPQGIIDVAVLPESMEQVDRKWLVEANLVYWDSRLTDLAAEANSMAVNGFTTWMNQAMKMNDRTKSLFDDDTNYPYLTEGIWYEKLPNFANTADLLTDQVDVLKEFSLATIDTTSTAVMPYWRVNSLGSENFIYSDWPIPIDLSYSDEDLKVGGTDGLPVGDLNWFPDAKATFLANHDKFYGDLVEALENGHTVTDVKELGGVPTQFELSQNYPNPFNPTTVITFTLPEPGNVTLKVYNTLGQEVATLVDGFKSAQKYQVTFDASNLASGVYIYTLQSDNFKVSKKMMLIK